VVLASFGLVLGALSLGIVGLAGLVPFEIVLTDVNALGGVVPWWAPLLVLAAATSVGYATSIHASQVLGSRLMSFVGMLEVVFASVFAWVLLGEALGVLQVIGGALILAGIALVRSEKQRVDVGELPIDAVPVAAEPAAAETVAG
jgi:drug/metabolite transporter (DMT)-like permease